MPRKTLRWYYILSALFSAGGMQMTSAMYATYLLDHGLSLLEVNIVNMVFFTSLFLWEIPTGAFADVFGRKASFIMSGVLISLGMFVYGSSSTFPGFILSEMIIGFGFTFKTGAFQSWLVDTLKHQGHEADSGKIFARETTFNWIGGAFGGLFGAYLATMNPAYSWYTGGIFMLITATLGVFVMEEGYFKGEPLSWRNNLRSMRSVTATSFHYARNDPAARFVLVIAFAQVMCVQSLNMYWQPFMGERGLSGVKYGFMYSGMMFSLAVGSYILSHLNTKGREKKLLIGCQLCVGVLITMLSLTSGLAAGVTLFLLHEVGRGWWMPLRDAYLHAGIKSSAERATIVSFCNISPHIGAALGLVVSGMMAELFGISAVWFGAGVVLVLTAFIARANGHGTH